MSVCCALFYFKFNTKRGELHLIMSKSKLLNALKSQANFTLTENLAASYKSTLSDCLDLFASIGALRNASEQDIILRFSRAFAEEPNLALKTLFYARDVRGGLGERRVFRIIIKWLAQHDSEALIKNLKFIPEFGRWDDLLILINTNNDCGLAALNFIKAQFELDLNNLRDNLPASLLAKWLPSINASNSQTVLNAKRIAKFLNLNYADYRKNLTALRNSIKLLENYLRERDYSFDYSKQPSRAMYKYKKAFIRNDEQRYKDFLEQVSQGKAKLNTGTLMPYDIVAPIVYEDNIPNYFYRNIEIEPDNNTCVTMTEDERKAADVTWNALENFAENINNALVVIDGSGSMYRLTRPDPASVALSLGIYFAERNSGAFKNHFITFSESPKLVEIKGRDIYEKVKYCMGFNEAANTNLQKVFELILNAAHEHEVKQADMPEAIYIISDMEFDYCMEDASMTNFDYAKKLFKAYGYKMPKIIFWNVDARNFQQPVTMNEQGVCLISGNSARLFNIAMRGGATPYELMLEVLLSERYKEIKY